MDYKVLSRCPVCSSRLRIVKLKCLKCGTIVENNFKMSKFEYLSNEQQKFIEIFVKCRGNIKDVEKELGISYPTVRAKLDDVISAMGYEVVRKQENNEKSVIDMLEKGEITADQAVEMLKE
ncbi:DUF2089 domain-containing protein [Clostridium oryzae]|uniref:DUF2089 domain-containing protein n=1 Tax=Clostridium oryzae TaxID=1450648 RepID=A0A1V4IQM4_9CLOT|nr:DUF2089 domain-containing protein [Clostridium oryzae]OPJ62226.1 hypothetical protein CLORY_18340 [Clostridium oryzae]